MCVKATENMIAGRDVKESLKGGCLSWAQTLISSHSLALSQHRSLHLSLTPSQEVQLAPGATCPSSSPNNTIIAVVHTKGEAAVSVLCIKGHRDVNEPMRFCACLPGGNIPASHL